MYVSSLNRLVLERKIVRFPLRILVIFLSSFLGKERSPSFEQGWIPFTLRCFEIGQSILEMKIFKLHQCIYVLWYFLIITLWKGCDPLFESTWILFTQRCVVPSLVEVSTVVMEKKINLWKVFRKTDGQSTDNMRSEKNIWAFSSGELNKNTKKPNKTYSDNYL